MGRNGASCSRRRRQNGPLHWRRWGWRSVRRRWAKCRYRHPTGAMGTSDLLPRCVERRLKQTAAKWTGEGNEFVSRSEGRGRRRSRIKRRRSCCFLRDRTEGVKAERLPPREVELRRFVGHCGRFWSEVGDREHALAMRAGHLGPGMGGINLDGPLAKRALQRNDRHQCLHKNKTRSVKPPV